MGIEVLRAVEFKPESDKIPNQSNPDRRKVSESEKLGREKILVVDDTPSWLWIARKILSAGGYEVEVCENSSDALSLLRKNPSDIDLVITDVNMPCLNGFELAAELLKINDALPVVLTSAARVEMTPAKLQSLGIRGFLTKPWQRERLFSTIQQALAYAGQTKRSEG